MRTEILTSLTVSGKCSFKLSIMWIRQGGGCLSVAWLCPLTWNFNVQQSCAVITIRFLRWSIRTLRFWDWYRCDNFTPSKLTSRIYLEFLWTCCCAQSFQKQCEVFRFWILLRWTPLQFQSLYIFNRIFSVSFITLKINKYRHAQHES